MIFPTTAPLASPKPIPPTKEVTLISPYISGDGKNFSVFKMAYSDFDLAPGMLLHNEVYDMFVVMSVEVQEDFFENVGTAICKLVTNDSTDYLDPNAKHVYYSYTKSD